MAYKLTSVRPCGDGGWRVYISDDAGHLPSIRRRIQANSQEEAEAKARWIFAEATGKWTVGHAVTSTLQEAAENVTPQTLAEYRSLARIFEPICSYRVDEVLPADLQALIDSSSSSPSKARKALTFIRKAMRIAVEAGGAAINPAKDVRFACPVKLECSPIDEKRLDSVVHLAQGTPACVVGLIYFCGLSVGEIAVLELKKSSIEAQGRVTRRSKGSARFIRYEKPVLKNAPAWLLEKAARSNPLSARIPFGSPTSPGNVDTIARGARSLLRVFGFNITLAQLRRIGADAAERRLP